MKTRKLAEGVLWVCTDDPGRRLFDELIPLPDGTTYNSAVITGKEKVALVDTSDPPFIADWLAELDKAGVRKVDYIVANHAEQDHSGALPAAMAKYPGARLLATPKGKGMLLDLLELPADRIQEVADGETLSLGGKTLRFVHFPWVHWPETMLTFLEEDRILFPCDLFGSHLSSDRERAEEDPRWMDAERRYYSEIMMPFRKLIGGNLAKVRALEPRLIAPSHGPVIGNPGGIIDTYADWTGDKVKNSVVIAYVSMHESTKIMVERLEKSLVARGVAVEMRRLSEGDVGSLASSLIDCATLVVGSPMVLGGPHPVASYAALLANLIKPKLKFLAVVGSYGWGGRLAEQLAGLVPGLRAEVVGSVLAKGLPRERDFAAIDALAGVIAEKHKGI